ncbi:MAG: transposase [Thermoguttaceae bacterium]|nr:transposase [Thermoguttaceae bacterium]
MESLPEVNNSPKRGQKRTPNRARLEGVIWLLRTGASWKDIPDRFPSGSTYLRRMQEWQKVDI